MDDAIELASMFGIELKIFDIGLYSENIIKDIKEQNSVNDEVLKDAIINIKPRLRMTILYAYAAMMSSVTKKTYLVVGTSNKSERFVGYFTKGGDGVFDIAPLADLYVDEVIKIGEFLGIPDHIIHKAPDDGLSGLSDEEKLGFTYENVKKVSLEYDSNNFDNTIDNSLREKILRSHYNNSHKFKTPMYLKKVENIGVYMGSFNPPHKGHIKVIKYLLKKKYVDKVLLVPTLNYWDKQDLVDIVDRINMLKFYENDKIMVDIKNNKYIYTIDLVKKLEDDYPNSKLSIIMGADNIVNFKKWKNYNDLLKYNIIIMNRGNIDIKKYLDDLNGNFTIIDDYLPVDISSTEVRNDISSKYLDRKVLDYIEKHHLY